MYFLLSFYLLLLSLTMFTLSIIFLSMKFNIMMTWTLMNLISYKIEFIMHLDKINLIFFSVVMMITSMVIMYSMEYMMCHIYTKRFMLLIIIFFISMILMITSPNMFSILLGWDGLGLSSYCLIIFYQNKNSFNSGMTTIMMNRMGDISILITIALLINNHSLNFMFMYDLPTPIMMFITMAAITKSAQIPFSTWLPLAMAAPTPVSSLVHSSTLVTAGIYLMIRFNYLLSPSFMWMLMMISCWTMFMASSSAMMEFDLKKIIALSTLSQLGLMFLSISMNLSNMAFFHLSTHAMFKSLLFLCSGIIIHNYFGNQDIRFISLINLNMPITNIIFNVSSLALCGLPFLSGFYSKDLIIEMFNMNNMNSLMFNLMYLSMMLTVMYSFRLNFYISMKPLKINNINPPQMKNLMNYSIYSLFMLSIFYGSILNWLMMNSLNLIFLPNNYKMLIYKIMIAGFIWTMIISFMKLNSFIIIYLPSYFMSSMWFTPMIYKMKQIFIFKMNNMMTTMIDLGWIEYASMKIIMFLMKKANNMKNIYKLNFSLLMLMTSYFLLMMLM